MLVCGGVLYLPKMIKVPGKFQIPYLNGKYLIPFFLIVFMIITRHRISDAFSNLNAESYQEFLFILFLISASIISILTYLRNYSIIPVLGVLFCLYLMIEIPAKSWMVFFGWMAFGLTIYLLYGRVRSRLADRRRRRKRQCVGADDISTDERK